MTEVARRNAPVRQEQRQGQDAGQGQRPAHARKRGHQQQAQAGRAAAPSSFDSPATFLWCLNKVSFIEMKTQMKRMLKVSPTVMAMTNRGNSPGAAGAHFHGGGGQAGDGGALRAQHDEDHAIQDQLHGVPHGLALRARSRQRTADQVLQWC